ncbi:MAG TPA: DUF3619 family protein [Steroidobacteraceae bacterium]|jgi:hypothetical protein|nr:DUF3619 family protein [Steroidobacteraceae bacterium]
MNQEGPDPGAVEFAGRARELLERSAHELPARIRSRLTRARHAALESRSERRGARSAPWRPWLPAGVAAAAVLAVLILEGPHLGADLPQASAGGGDDYEMLADSGAFALAQDQLMQGGEVDYEFYDWAVNTAQDERGGEAGS